MPRGSRGTLAPARQGCSHGGGYTQIGPEGGRRRRTRTGPRLRPLVGGPGGGGPPPSGPGGPEPVLSARGRLGRGRHLPAGGCGGWSFPGLMDTQNWRQEPGKTRSRLSGAIALAWRQATLPAGRALGPRRGSPPRAGRFPPPGTGDGGNLTALNEDTQVRWLHLTGPWHRNVCGGVEVDQGRPARRTAHTAQFLLGRSNRGL